MGYRSRASFKLIELDEKDKLFKSGMMVVDLGAAPGGWSQIAAERVGDHGRVVASDILPMDSMAGVEFIQGDFTEEEVLNQILAALGDEPADLVISDMAPNMSGMNAVDQPAAMYLGGAGVGYGTSGACVRAVTLWLRSFRVKALIEYMQ